MIDWARVSELQAEIGHEDFMEVVEMFLSEAEEVVTRLDAGIDAEDIEGALHYLNGSALNLGFTALAALCQEGEKLAPKGEVVDLQRIAANYRASCTAFSKGLRKLSAA
jgi:HPt (histidine-containing phosphotransfer) domain-containing protein